MGRWIGRTAAVVVALTLLAIVGWLIVRRLMEERAEARTETVRKPVPVEVASITTGPIELVRGFSGTVEAPAQFDVAPKVTGRINRLLVQIADPVRRGQVVAELDDDEFRQAVAQAEAERSVAQATLVGAQNDLKIAERQLERVESLLRRSAVTEGQVDVARAEQLAKSAAVAVAKAEVTRAEAVLGAAQVRLGYATVRADWNGEDDERFVAERYMEEGDPVMANAPLISVVDLDPILAVIYVTERDYGNLQTGQGVTLTTDAFPGRQFQGKVIRVSPVFRMASRQARVELTIPNPDHLLKPGMFVRAKAVLDRVEEAQIVPIESIVMRSGSSHIFLVDEETNTVRMEPVDLGIQQDGLVQVIGQNVQGRVVTLGMQLLDDGSKVSVVTRDDTTPEAVSTNGVAQR